jgi:type I restriction enzyme, S subunit
MNEKTPAGWSVYPFKDICYFQEGPGLRNWQYKKKGIKFLNIRCIKDGKVDLSIAQHVAKEEVNNKYKHFLLDPNDYVLSSSGTLGRLAKIDASNLPLLLNTSIIRFRSSNENLLDHYFLRYFLQSKYFFDKISEQSQGSAQVNFGPTHLKRMNFALPTLPEQKKIASILNSVEEVIENIQSQINKHQDLTISIMNELFTKGIGYKEFKNSEFGKIPKLWKIEKLKDLTVKISDRNHTTPIYTDSKNAFPIISPKDLDDNMDLNLDKIKYISAKDHDENRLKTDLLPDDIIFSRIGAGLGKSYLIKKNFYNFSILHSLCQIRVNTKILPHYLNWFLKWNGLKKKIWLGVQSIGVPDLGLEEISKLPIIVPANLNEQIHISNILDNLKDFINTKINKLKKIKNIKKSLMQDLLTGKVKV